jgi:hypothetical protein
MKKLAKEAMAKKIECEQLIKNIKHNMKNYPEIAYHQTIDLKQCSQKLAGILQKISEV